MQRLKDARVLLSSEPQLTWAAPLHPVHLGQPLAYPGEVAIDNIPPPHPDCAAGKPAGGTGQGGRVDMTPRRMNCRGRRAERPERGGIERPAADESCHQTRRGDCRDSDCGAQVVVGNHPRARRRRYPNGERSTALDLCLDRIHQTFQ